MSEDLETPEVSEAPESVSEAPVESAPSEPVAESTPWDSFRSLPEFQGQDDKQIAAGLYQAMQREQAASKALRQYQQVMPVAQEYLTHRAEFEKWKQAQTQQAEQPKEEKPAWWNPPQVSDAHRRYLTRDENGREVIAENAPLDAQAALSEYMNYRADFAQKFLNNPEETLGPMVQDLAQKQAQEMIQQTLQRRDDEEFVRQIQAENEDWLIDQDTGGVSPAGLLMNKYIEQAKSHGINGPRARWDYARAMSERDLLVQRYDSEMQQPVQRDVPQEAPVQQAQEPAPPDLAQKNMDYLRKEASRNPSRSAGSANADPRQPRPKRTFEQMLLDEASSRELL